jgi:replicative DNA helicase
MNRNDILGIISAELKDIAKECNIPVIALAQLSRKAESTSDGRPGLEHLREGGSIEQDADLVAFIHRPSYYTKGDQNKEKEIFLKEMDAKEYEEYSEFIIEKHRNGKLTTVREYFHGASQNFKEFFKEEENKLATSTDYTETSKEKSENLPF